MMAMFKNSSNSICSTRRPPKRSLTWGQLAARSLTCVRPAAPSDNDGSKTEEEEEKQENDLNDLKPRIRKPLRPGNWLYQVMELVEQGRERENTFYAKERLHQRLPSIEANILFWQRCVEPLKAIVQRLVSHFLKGNLFFFQSKVRLRKRKSKSKSLDLYSPATDDEGFESSAATTPTAAAAAAAAGGGINGVAAAAAEAAVSEAVAEVG